MEKQTTTKIILGLIIFIVFVFQVSSPIQAATSSMSNLYSNPNQSGDSTYKFKISDVVSSQMLTNVVGCTGVVNKTSAWMAKFISSPVQEAKKTAETIKIFVNSLKKACTATKAAAVTTGQSIPTMPGYGLPISQLLSLAELVPGGSKLGGPNTLAPGPTAPPVSTKVKACQDQVDATSPELLAEAQKQTEQDAEKNMREQCFDGIAITLAKNQLTSMTRSMMNWVNTGYGGNPFFVQNMQDLTNNLERNVLETGIDILLSPGSGNSSPYAQDFASSAVTSGNLLRSSSGLLGNLQSSLENFITDPKSFYTNDQRNQAQITRNALQRAQDANNAFANDFSIGGWNGWLALTQIDQNNPLGYTMQAAQELADRQAAQVSQTQNELNQNNGFLSQKTCDEWQVYDTEDGKPKNVAGKGSTVGALPLYQKNKPNICYKNSNSGDGDCCTHFKIITPGSLIKDKVTNYINSPERQLELAKTINDSLNALFSVLLSKLEGGGLAGLSDSATDAPMNWTDNMNTTSDFTSSDGNSTYNNNGAYDGFNLTRDLGNTYIHDPTISLGTWNAKACPLLPGDQTNCNIVIETNPIYLLKSEANGGIKLYPDTAPEVYQVPTGVNTAGDTKLSNDLYGNLVNPINGYYTVTTAGNTKLMVDGYNGWAKGDRAFWDGSNWQNWKCGPLNTKGECTVQANPIKQRGVVQIQQDYIVAGKEILGVLPSIMPKLGKLDYCLPGPNPSYKTNSADAQSAYQDWIGSMYVGPRDANRDEWRIDQKDTRTYNNLANIFTDNPNTWEAVLASSSMSLLDGFYKNWVNTRDEGTIVGKILHFIGANDKIGKDGDCVVTETNVLGKATSTPGDCPNYHWHKDGQSLSGHDQADIDNRKALMDLVLDEVNNYMFQDFYNIFDTKMNELYFNNMTSQYKDTETRIGLDKNPAYVSMATAGLDYTKDIIYYNDDTTKAVQDYTDTMTQAKINIAKLEPIKTEVSGIILTAQDRQIANIITALKKLNGSDSYTPSASEIAKYRTDNKACLDEENIQVFDPDKITNGGVRIENCTDGIDNDLNGLVDILDPVCKGYVVPNTNRTRDVVPNTSGTRRDAVPTNTSGTSTSGTSTSGTRRP